MRQDDTSPMPWQCVHEGDAKPKVSDRVHSITVQILSGELAGSSRLYFHPILGVVFPCYAGCTVCQFLI